jgi:hypothetical protein
MEQFLSDHEKVAKKQESLARYREENIDKIIGVLNEANVYLRASMTLPKSARINKRLPV